MVNVFAVTVATSNVKLDGKKQGEVSFTVSNTSGRALDGRARIVPQAGTPLNWFTLADEAQRSFAVNGTQQYTVNIAVPPDAPAGRYLFRLDMVGIANPDEEFAEGPTVAFDVATPTPTKKPFPWWILLLILAGLVVCVAGVAGISLLLRGGGGEITDLEGIFEAIGLEDLQTDKATYIAGEKVVFTYSLVNQTRDTLIVPLNNDFSQPFFLIGIRQQWIERLEADTDIPALAGAARDGDRFAIGGSIIPVDEEVAPGQAISFTEGLNSTGFAPGRYRITVEYKALDSDEVLDEASVEFEVR
ncbi:MAG: hypothetical protein L0332_21075 [Chloroflexi bacterium]|nr:hypothetical protein [Chloroflexota bacterium]MCI0578456.1 hypothetical protein [Chloroflexota bacterium]MCI0643902.1 hypothetical protein [Chloroflexota bacterium]MCI0729188.1 hypothetical protein [Chloroflexota bacterium]